MKKFLFILMAAGALSACNNSDKKNDSTTTADTAIATAENAPVIKFDEESHDFGKVTEGEKVSYSFKFTNAGKKPLIITSAVASCGCTVPEWPKTPVLPGKTGEIAVVFNSAGKKGLQDKQITVSANTNPPQSVVHLIGEVLIKK